jgi:hypothetical protein
MFRSRHVKCSVLHKGDGLRLIIYAFWWCEKVTLNCSIGRMENCMNQEIEIKHLEETDLESRDISVGIAIGYWLDYWSEVGVPVGSRIFSSPRRPERLWGPLSLLSNGYRGLFPPG